MEKTDRKRLCLVFGRYCLVVRYMVFLVLFVIYVMMFVNCVYLMYEFRNWGIILHSEKACVPSSESSYSSCRFGFRDRTGEGHNDLSCTCGRDAVSLYL